MPYDPSDNDDDCVEFEVEKIEQMQVELIDCPLCKGAGIAYNGIIFYNCPSCYGTGSIKEVD